MENTRQLHLKFLTVEIATGLQLAKLAKLSNRPQRMAKTRAEALRAYDEVDRHLGSLSKQEVKEFRAELRDLQRALQELGETF
jgi:hypothetical protein